MIYNQSTVYFTHILVSSLSSSSLKCLFRPYMVKAMGRSVTLAPTDVWNLVLSPYTAEKGRWSLLIALLLLLFIFTVVDTNNDINRMSHPSTFKHATECLKGQRSELRWLFCNTGEYKMYLLLLSDYVHFFLLTYIFDLLMEYVINSESWSVKCSICEHLLKNDSNWSMRPFHLPWPALMDPRTVLRPALEC